MNFSYNGHHFAKCSVTRIRGSHHIGGYRLWFHVDVSMRGTKDLIVRVTEIRGEVHIRFPGNKDHLLGALWPEGPVYLQTFENTHEANFGLFVDLDDRRLEEIEEMRDGCDLTFRVHIMGVADGTYGLWAVNEWLQPEFVANQSTWLRVLEEMQYQRSFLFEVAIPKSEESSAFCQSVTYLLQAHQDFMGGRYEDAIGDCRKSLERLTDRLQDQLSSDAAIKQYCRVKESERATNSSSSTEKRDSRKAMSLEERFLLLRATLQHVSNIAHHATDQQPEYRRSDAKCVIALTTALVDRFRANL